MGEALSAVGRPLYSAADMEWKTMRAHYEGLFASAKDRGETQETVAARGGIRQNKISRIFSIEKLGPQVETFIRAIEGLNMKPSEFFLQVEQSQRPVLTAELGRSHSNGSPKIGEPSHGDSIPSRGVDALVDEVLLELGARIATAARTAGETGRPHRAVSKTRRAKPLKRKRGA